jgi:restriction system protein
VPGKKRRKSTGVTSFLADALAEQRKARALDERLQRQAAIAWAKEDARNAAITAREKTRADREREIAEGHAEAEAVTRAFRARLTELDTLLASTLEEDPCLSFDQLREPSPVPDFQAPAELATAQPAPREEDFMPSPPSGVRGLAPGGRRAYAAATALARDEYEQAAAQYAQAERQRQELLAQAHAKHERAVADELVRIQQQHAVIDRLAAGFARGERKAVAGYFREVLARQRYPSDFPTGVRVAYLPSGQEVIVDVDLPLLAAIPETASCEYLQTKKALRYKALSVAARNALYQSVIAQMALRTVRAVFLADQSGLVRSVGCNGYVDIINTATGQPAHWCLVSIQVTRETFEGLDLARVRPLDCLAYLHAKISRTPEKCLPVQPIIEYPWDDLPYSAEADSISALDTVQNLLDLDGYEFEKLILQLFEAIPEFSEVRRTRSRSDGGIDVVAVNTTPFVGGRVAIQAKRYAPHHKVDIAAVREVVGSISQREFNKGIIITTSDFTRAAREEAARVGVELYECERLLWLLRHYLRREYNVIDEERRKPPIKDPPRF